MGFQYSTDANLLDDTLSLTEAFGPMESEVKAPYTRQVAATKISPSDKSPKQDDIRFVKGDQWDLHYLWQNVVWTPERPTDDSDLPMYSEAEVAADLHTTELDEAGGTGPYVEGTDYSDTSLIADWEQQYWHAEVRSGFISTYRMYNGWVPWYGRRPKWGWWNKAGLRGIFVTDAYYDVDFGGTVTHLIMPSLSSNRMYPSDSYRWDLERAQPVEWDEEDPPNPIKFTALKTMVGGASVVLQDWTQNTPIT